MRTWPFFLISSQVESLIFGWAIAGAVLFRRVRTLLIRPDDKGLAATTLNFDYEVRSSEQAFSEVPAKKISGEMLDLAVHIIKTRAGAFDPRAFHDRYEGALAELVTLKVEGKPIPRRAAPEGKAGVSLLQALRESAAGGGASAKSPARKAARGRGAAKAEAAAPRRKAG